MLSQLRGAWDHLRSSFWFLPSLMAAGAIGLAFASVSLDESVPDEWLRRQAWAYTGGAEGASAVLGTVAGSMITIAGVVFSLTLVALSLASSQFGPRLLRNFMRDTTNQVVLGTFVGTFLYCLLVLRTIRRADEIAFVPHLSISLGVLFAIASLGVLIYFIHHVSVSIQADEIVARVGTELLQGIDRLFPEAKQGAPGHPGGSSDERLDAPIGGTPSPVGAGEDGYIQRIDLAALVAVGVEVNGMVRVERRPGEYVVRDGSLATIVSADEVTHHVVSRVRSAFMLGNQRIPNQDLGFPVDQLVEIAVRALSPGVNDPFTAMACVDRLGSALCRLAQRDMPSPERRYRENRLRLEAHRVTFEEITDAAFDQIRRNARSSPAVTLRLLDTLAVVAEAARQPDQRAVLRRHAEQIIRGAQSLPDEEDRRAVEARFQATMFALRESLDAER